MLLVYLVAVRVGKGLEIRFTLTGNGGSNPSLSANPLKSSNRWQTETFNLDGLLRLYMEEIALTLGYDPRPDRNDGTHLDWRLILPVDSMSIPRGFYAAESSGMLALTSRFSNSRKNNSRMRGSSSSNSICTPPVSLYLAPAEPLYRGLP